MLASLLGTAAGAFFGGAPGAAVGASVGGAIDRNSAAAESAQQAQAFSASQYASRYQTQVKDMEAAGLNPMLAYMQSPGASPQGVTYQPTNIAERVASDYSSAYNVERLGKKIETETELKAAQIEQVNESVKKIGAEIRNLDTDNDRLKSLIDNLREERQNLIKQNWNLTEQGNMLRATVDKLKAEIPVLNSKTFLQIAQENLANLEGKLKSFDVQSAERADNFGRDAQQYRILLDIYKALVKAR